jgi:flagellar motor switch protein FliG
MNPIDAPKITRDLGQETLAKVIAGAKTDADAAGVEFLLSNISKRMADALRELSEDYADIRPKDTEAAMADVVNAVRELADAGEITLNMASEDDD